MSSTSTQIAAKGALFDLLDSAPSLAGINVAWGYTGRMKKEGVYVGNIRGEFEPYGLGTSRPREETFTIDLSVATQGRRSQRQVTERLGEMAALVEALLLGDDTLDGEVRYAAMRSSELREGLAGEDRFAYIDFEIEVRATLR